MQYEEPNEFSEELIKFLYETQKKQPPPLQEPPPHKSEKNLHRIERRYQTMNHKIVFNVVVIDIEGEVNVHKGFKDLIELMEFIFAYEKPIMQFSVTTQKYPLTLAEKEAALSNE